VRTAVMKALTSLTEILERLSRPDVLPLLRELAPAPDDTVAAEAVRDLILLCPQEELEAFPNKHDQKLCVS